MQARPLHCMQQKALMIISIAIGIHATLWDALWEGVS